MSIVLANKIIGHHPSIIRGNLQLFFSQFFPFYKRRLKVKQFLFSESIFLRAINQFFERNQITEMFFPKKIIVAKHVNCADYNVITISTLNVLKPLGNSY